MSATKRRINEKEVFDGLVNNAIDFLDTVQELISD